MNEIPTTGPSGALTPRRAWFCIASICFLFVVMRLPVAWRQLPAQDEDYFTVPGLTILESGSPRIPYLPSRNPESAFYKADEVLFALPPLYFYAEAAVYSALGASTGAARLVSLMCGVSAIVAVFALARRLFGDPAAGVWSAALFALSRVLYFPAVTARPDMLCGALGLIAMLVLQRFTIDGRRRWLLLAGCLIGGGLLTHPFAAVFAMQAGVWVLLQPGKWTERLQRAAILTLVACGVFATWGLLIWRHPEIFETQFSNNVLNKSGPGLVARLVWPVAALRVQTSLFLEQAGVPQAALMMFGLLAAVVLAVRLPAARTVVALAVSGVYLHVAIVGLHPTKGYWCYTGALLFICLGGVTTHVLRGAPRWGIAVAAVVLAGLMLPGTGLRTVAAHIRNWDNADYDAPRFTRQLINEIPPEDFLVVDTAYVFEFYRAGRPVLLAREHPFYFSVRGADYDRLIAGPYSIRDGIAEILDAEFERSYGDRNDPFACYAEVYRAPAVEPAR